MTTAVSAALNDNQGFTYSHFASLFISFITQEGKHKGWKIRIVIFLSQQKPFPESLSSELEEEMPFIQRQLKLNVT